MALLDAKVDKPIRQHELLDCLIRLFGGNRDRPRTNPTGDTIGLPAQLRSSPRALRILLAEDNQINQRYAVALLEKSGHSVTVAANGILAVDAVMKDSFDVVLMDAQMPELDGIGATRQIRALPSPKRDVPILALTANAMEGAGEQYLEAGMDGYITKPIQPAALLARLADIARILDASTANSAASSHDAGNALVLDRKVIT
jgi:CheY-like chemotaxis protein